MWCLGPLLAKDASRSALESAVTQGESPVGDGGSWRAESPSNARRLASMNLGVLTSNPKYTPRPIAH